ncbi:hypothetical protein [Leptolyngbya sp. 7M]|uniref:hypothetical protein n=1 Tax=Leptolyngbya sp. 7M TaxID=2812896 RepID=UPI001B8BEE98|nr:hypothetical protein [Leptolyngbya sp. 7M]QYO67319.1 hypothetical protein JVX88_11240 [Leptolyngbya sp. 7M]
MRTTYEFGEGCSMAMPNGAVLCLIVVMFAGHLVASPLIDANYDLFHGIAVENNVCRGEQFTSIDDFIGSPIADGGKLVDEARGDLDRDRIPDWVGLLQRERKEELETGITLNIETLQLFVLIGESPAGFRCVEKSKEAPFREGLVLYEGMEIKNSRLIVQINTKTLATAKAVHYTFGLNEGSWELVGLRKFELDTGSDTSIETVTNLVTGQVTVKRQRGKERPLVQRYRSRVSRSHSLEDFDFSDDYGSL